MRYAMLAALLTAAIVTPAMAAKPVQTPDKHTVSAPGWNDCYELAWIRGVHVELGELPEFMDECRAGVVPFGDDFAKYVRSLSQ